MKKVKIIESCVGDFDDKTAGLLLSSTIQESRPCQSSSQTDIMSRELRS